MKNYISPNFEIVIEEIKNVIMESTQIEYEEEDGFN